MLELSHARISLSKSHRRRCRRGLHGKATRLAHPCKLARPRVPHRTCIAPQCSTKWCKYHGIPRDESAQRGTSACGKGHQWLLGARQWTQREHRSDRGNGLLAAGSGAMRMKESTKRLIWVSAGGRCIVCNRYLVSDHLDDSAAVRQIGEVAHIVGKSAARATRNVRETAGRTRQIRKLDLAVPEPSHRSRQPDASRIRSTQRSFFRRGRSAKSRGSSS